MNDDEFIKLIADRAPALLSEPLQAEARRRQAVLISSSIVTVLLFGGFISVGETTIGVVKFTPIAGNHFGWVVWAITCYSLLAYILSCYQDWKAYGYATLPKLHDHLASLVSHHTDANQGVTRNLALFKEIQVLADARRAADNDRNKRFQQRMEEYQQKTDSGQAGFDAAFWKEMFDEPEPYNDGLEAKRIEFDQSIAETNSSINRRASLVLLSETAFRLRRLRYWLDVVFPVGLALYALVYAFIRHSWA